MASTPFTFDDVKKSKKSHNMDIIIDAVNKLLVKNFSKRSSIIISQDELIKEIKSLNDAVTNSELFENHYLDIEDLYENYGWKVTYNKSAYNEESSSTFTFEKLV